MSLSIPPDGTFSARVRVWGTWLVAVGLIILCTSVCLCAVLGLHLWFLAEFGESVGGVLVDLPGTLYKGGGATAVLVTIVVFATIGSTFNRKSALAATVTVHLMVIALFAAGKIMVQASPGAGTLLALAMPRPVTVLGVTFAVVAALSVRRTWASNEL